MRAPVASLSKKLVSTFCAAMLVVGLLPAVAFASEDDSAGADSTTVTGEDADNVSESEFVDAPVDASDSVSSDDSGSGSPVVPILASTLSSGASILRADVTLGSEEIPVGSFTTDGLTFSVIDNGVMLVAVSTEVKLSDETGVDSDGISSSQAKILALPETVVHDDRIYEVTSVGPYAFYLSSVTEVILPATIVSIDDRAFRYSDITAIDTAIGNPKFASFDGVLYDATFSSLLLIPEGRLGAVCIAPDTTSIDSGVFSHCPSVNELVVDAGSAAFSSVDGCLYDAYGTTLLRVPVGATDIAIAENCLAIAEGALEGCAGLESIQAPEMIESISPYAFSSLEFVRSPLPPSSAIDGAPREFERTSGLATLSSSTGTVAEVDPSSITVYVPAGSDVGVWQQAGFNVMYSAPFGEEVVDFQKSEAASLSASIDGDDSALIPESELDGDVEAIDMNRYGTAEATKTVQSSNGSLRVAGRDASNNLVADWVLDGTFDGLVSWPASAGSDLPRYGAYGSGSASTPITVTVLRLQDSNHGWKKSVFANSGKGLKGFRVRTESGSGSFDIDALESGKKFFFTVFAEYLDNVSYVNPDGSVNVQSRANPLLPVYENSFTVNEQIPTRTIQIWSHDVNGATTSASPLYGTFTGRVTWPIEAGDNIPHQGRYGTAGERAEVNIEIDTFQAFTERYWEDSAYQKEGCTVVGFRVRAGCGEGFISVEDLERGTGFSFMLYALSLNAGSTLSSSNALVASSNWPLEAVHARTTADGTIQAWAYDAAGVPSEDAVLNGAFSGTVSWPSSYGDTLPAGSAVDKAQANITVKVDSYTSAYTKWNSSAFRKDGYALVGFRVREGCGEGVIPIGSLQNSEPFTITFRANTLHTSSFYDAASGRACLYTQSYPLEPILEKKSEVNFGTLAVFSKTAAYTDGGAVLEGEFYGSVSWPNGVAGDGIPVSGSTPVRVSVMSYTSSAEPWKDPQFVKDGCALIGFQVRQGCGTGFISVGALQQGGPFSFVLYGLSVNPVSYLTEEGVAHIRSSNWPLEPVYENGTPQATGSLTIWSRSVSGQHDTSDAPIVDGLFTGNVSWPYSAGTEMPRYGHYGSGNENTPVTINVFSFATSTRGWRNETYFKKDDTSVLEGFRVRNGCGNGFITVETLEKGLPFSITLNARNLQSSCYVNGDGTAFVKSRDFPLEPVYSHGAYKATGTIQVFSFISSGVAGGPAPISGSFTGSVAWPSSAGTTLPRYDNYGGGTKDTSVTVTVESFTYSSKTWEDPRFKKNGYALIGFQVRTGCGGGYVSIADLESGKPFRFALNAEYIASNANANVTGAKFESRANPLEPVYTATSISCTFEANNGTADKYTTLSLWGGYLVLPTDEPTMTGYDFEGWYTEKQGGTEVTAATQTPTSAKTYYGHWSEKTYSVTYDRGYVEGGTSVYRTDAGVPWRSTAQTLPDLSGSRIGYDFLGWSRTQGAASATWKGGATKTVSDMLNGGDLPKTFTLYAVWSIHDYNISYVDADGTTAISDDSPLWKVESGKTHPQKYNVATPTINLSALMKAGYSFAGWVDAETGEPVSSIASGSTGDLTLKATWSAPLQYQISYLDAEEPHPAVTWPAESSEADHPSGYDITRAIVVSMMPVKDGFMFTGWSSEPEGAPSMDPITISAGSTGSRIFYAHWKPAGYTILFDANLGEDDQSLTLSAQSVTAAVGSNVDMASAERYGYRFLGWCADSTGTVGSLYSAGLTSAPPDELYEAAHASDGRVELYAQWELRYDVDVPVISPADDVNFEVDLSNNGVSVSDRSNGHRELLSYMPVAVKLSKVSCDALVSDDGSGSLAVNDILGSGAADAITMNLTPAGNANNAIDLAMTGSQATALSPTGFVIPAANAPARQPGAEWQVSVGRLDVGLWMSIDPGFVPNSRVGETKPVARIIYTVDLQ